MNIYEAFLISIFIVEKIDLRGPPCFRCRLIWFQPFSPLSYHITFLISTRIFFLSACAFLFKYISLMVHCITRAVHHVYSVQKISVHTVYFAPRVIVNENFFLAH
jgi:hypothetical protein